MVNRKQFGIWMDGYNATVIGSDNAETENLVVLAHIKGEEAAQNSNEKNGHNHQQSLQAKFFKEITANMQNATHLHVTGTGQAQEQFIHYLAETPQFKNTKTEESTSNKMSDENLVEYISNKLN
jgi:stalled ribosome rescue protein Dom34